MENNQVISVIFENSLKKVSYLKLDTEGYVNLQILTQTQYHKVIKGTSNLLNH